MLGRLGIAGRLFLIILLVLFAALALGTGVAFMGRGANTGTGPRVPVPDQVAAIVELLEQVPAENRAFVLRAVNSDFLGVTVSSARPALTAGNRRMPGVEWFVDQYLSKTGEHEIYAWDEFFERSTWAAIFQGDFLKAAGSRVRIAVSLRNGGFAVFETRGEIVRIFGLPIGFWIGVLGVAVALIAVRAILKEARPLQALAAAVQSFALNATPVRVMPSGAKETQALVIAVNDMQSKIAQLLASRTLLLGAISHDLKTFLTRLRLRIESIPDAEQHEKAMRDLDDMSKLIDDALAMAKGTATKRCRETVDLAKVIAGEVADRPGGKITVFAHEQQSLVVDGDPVALRRLIANLLDNALRFGTRSEISLQSAGAVIRLCVDDDGPGIPPKDREAVFEAFYRVEPSRSRDTGGTGLGLTIAKQIVDGHDGRISILQAPLGGARITVELPAARSAGLFTIRNTKDLTLQNSC